MKEALWNYLSEMKIEDFFITADIASEGKMMPEGLSSFISLKLDAIRKGSVHSRKFVFKEGEWRIILTFFPTFEVVDERYALKNKVARK